MKRSDTAKAKQQISQATFDECVKENMEEFDMGLDEATADAIQQFETQGVDLSNIIKHPAGAENGLTLDALTALLQALEQERTDTNASVSRLTQLAGFFDQIPEAKVIAGRNNGVAILLRLMHDEDATVAAEASALLAAMCSESTDNQDFVGQEGVEQMVALLAKAGAAHVPRVLACTRAMCSKHETNKAHFSKARGIDKLCEYFPTSKQDDAVSKNLAALLRTLTICDDPNATFSQAQETVKSLVAKDIIPFILEVVRDNKLEKPDVVAAWLPVLKQLAVTEDSCKQIHQLQGVELLHDIMIEHETNPTVTKRCITVFRNVAAADEIKEFMLRAGCVERTLVAMKVHVADASLQQHACATLAAIALRSPENSKRIVELGAARSIATAMRHHQTDTTVLRQASLAIRNIVARSAELRPRILEEDVEPLLREAQKYRGCGDEAYGALRDLGCDIRLMAYQNQPRANFNPVNVPSTALLDAVDEAAEAPFAS
ncbi:TPA: hypothetical protein N0F65_010132 [Lagenidium giganteum]|uniref:Protein zer-1 homolog-like C-terminal domain-containing protein n=1 Tax=Lagenidium giganteum TaxID=4803 RepID=A0AAV2Z8H0_9STRA|nr:TPA: hypothetical protein N0F65_010132 [Lagenidium giganteum]